MSQSSESTGSSEPPEINEEAISTLHAELFQVLVRIAWSILRDQGLAKDAAQEAFALLTEKLETQPDSIPVQNRKGWLVKTAQFAAHNIRRKQTRQIDFSGAGIGDFHAQAESEDHLIQQEDLTRLASGIQQLPEPQRNVVQLRFQENLTFAEIAAREKTSLNTVLSRMRLALSKLRKQLQDSSE